MADSGHEALAAGMVAGFIIEDQGVKYVHFRRNGQDGELLLLLVRKGAVDGLTAEKAVGQSI